MKKRDYRDYLQDIVDSIDDIELFAKDMSYADFAKDKKTINATVRSIEIIGEATKKLPLSLRNKYPAIPWKKMAGMSRFSMKLRLVVFNLLSLSLINL